MLSMKVFPPNAYYMYLLFIFRLIFFVLLLYSFIIGFGSYTDYLCTGRLLARMNL